MHQPHWVLLAQAHVAKCNTRANKAFSSISTRILIPTLADMFAYHFMPFICVHVFELAIPNADWFIIAIQTGSLFPYFLLQSLLTFKIFITSCVHIHMYMYVCMSLCMLLTYVCS